ncbi:MAG: hypothetical protein RLN62_02535 [Rickettsiales bacterium]
MSSYLRSINQDSKVGFTPPTPVLGQGWSTDKQMASSLNCFVPGNVTTTGGGSNIIEFSNSQTFVKIQEELNIDVSEKDSFGPFSSSESAQYAQTVQDDFYSQSFYYYEKIFLPTQVFNIPGYGNELLSPLGAGMHNASVETFRLECGDQLITQIQQGISFYASLQIQFASLYYKQTFSEHAGASFGSIVDVSSSVKEMVSDYGLEGSVQLTAFQQGGDPSQLAKTFNKDPSGGYYITSCSLKDLDACQGVVNGILSYAQNNIPGQSQSPSPLNYQMIDLGDLGITTGNTTVTPEVEAARVLLGGVYLIQSVQKAQADHIISSPYAQYIPILDQVKTIDSNLDYNLDIMQDDKTGIAACYTSPPTCPTTAATIMSELKSIDTNTLAIFTNQSSYEVTAQLTLVYSKDLDVPEFCNVVPQYSEDSKKSTALISINTNLYLNTGDPTQQISLTSDSKEVDFDWEHCYSSPLNAPLTKTSPTNVFQYSSPEDKNTFPDIAPCFKIVVNDYKEYCSHTPIPGVGCSFFAETIYCGGDITFTEVDSMI